MNINEKIKELTNKAIEENLTNVNSTGVTLASIVAANFHQWDTVLKPICKNSGIGYVDQIQKILASAGKQVSPDSIISALSYQRKKLKKKASVSVKLPVRKEINIFSSDDGDDE